MFELLCPRIEFISDGTIKEDFSDGSSLTSHVQIEGNIIIFHRQEGISRYNWSLKDDLLDLTLEDGSYNCCYTRA
jgi:hypothetical protein